MSDSEKAPRTIGRALDELEAALFVNREQELDTFATWIGATDAAPVLNVVGRGGMGKTTLLSAFSRVARASGRVVLSVDAEAIEPTPTGFLTALAPTAPDPVAYCNERPCLILVDSFAKIPWLTRFLQSEFLPALTHDAKVVIAGRIPLGWTRWTALIETITLQPLSKDSSAEYLRRRGITDPKTIDQVSRAALGLPVALALAADLVVTLGARGLEAAGEWRLVVRSLVERLFAEIGDEELAQLLEACAIVRHFDEPTLAAMTDLEAVSDSFARLCGLSAVRAGEHGLILHDDVRQVIADDLRWRNPERHAELRKRALGYLRLRMARAPVHERHWLWAERMFLWQDAFVHSVLFGPSTSSDVLVTLGGPEDADAAIALEREWHEEVLPTVSRVEWSENYPQEGVLAWLRRAMRLRGARLALARDLQGQPVGYSLVLPVYRESLPLLRADETLAALVRAYWPDEVPSDVPADPEDAEAYVIVRTCVTGPTPESISGALFRDLLGLLAREGVYLVYAAFPERRALYEALGFTPVAATEVYHWIADFPFQAYVLDLKQIGFEAWIEAVMAGRAPTRRPATDDIEAELTDVLPRWDDEDAVARSQLVALAGDPESARSMVRAAIEDLGSDPELDLPLRAVRLAYIERAASHERLAQRLAVSRSTFYRMLRRGIRAIAERLSAPAA